MLFSALSLLVAQSFAGTDISPSIAAPTGVSVYGVGRYTVTVSNVGTTNANASVLTIQLPVTHTTPVYVMGTVGAKSSVCNNVGTTIVCNIPSIRKGRSTSIYFDITLPENTDPLVFTATTTLANDSTNNTATATATLNNYSVAFTSGNVTASHCTGTALTSYYECTLFPSSISSFTSTLNLDGSVSISGYPDYSGTWSQPSPDTMLITYTDLGVVVAEFEGYGVPGNCWEGLTTFPNSAYVSMYKVCR